MNVLVTGGAGFIGGSVVRQLVARGDRVVAIVRDPDRTPELHALGVEVRRGDLTRIPAIVDALRGCDGVIHLAGDYRVGIPASERPAMLEANLGSTSRVLEAVATSGVVRLVYASTVNVFGDTHGRIVDERYRRDLADGFLSYYDETKFLAHRAVEERIGTGLPVVIAMLGTNYGRGDHSALGGQLEQAYRGTAPFVIMGDVGMSAVYVEDTAAGLIAALDRGRIGESYILAGENLRLRDAMAVAARVGGHRRPRLEIPNGLVRLGSHAPAFMARAVGYPDDLREVARSIGVTFWASSAKAATELGYRPRDLASGARAAFGSDGA